MCACNPSTWEVKAKRSSSRPASATYPRLCGSLSQENQTKQMTSQKEGNVNTVEGRVGLSDNHFTVSYAHLTCLGPLRSLRPRLFKTEKFG